MSRQYTWVDDMIIFGDDNSSDGLLVIIGLVFLFQLMVILAKVMVIVHCIILACFTVYGFVIAIKNFGAAVIRGAVRGEISTSGQTAAAEQDCTSAKGCYLFSPYLTAVWSVVRLAFSLNMETANKNRERVLKSGEKGAGRAFLGFFFGCLNFTVFTIGSIVSAIFSLIYAPVIGIAMLVARLAHAFATDTSKQ